MEPIHNKIKVALGLSFFLSGVCFSSWASRIPTIKETFSFNEAELGSLLFVLPISSLISLPFSGWLVAKYDSRYPLLVGFVFFCLGLFAIALATTITQLTLAVFLFSFSMRIINIAMNTQSLVFQKIFPKKINGLMHGLWSMGGLFGILYSTLMVRLEMGLVPHLLSVGSFTLVLCFLSFPFLLKNDRQTEGNKIIFGKPDKYILTLGLLVFFAAICEGGMYDWSGVYFREVVGVELFTLSYLAFMISMTLSRFISDRFIDRLGESKYYILSASVGLLGIAMVILFPYYVPALIGFSIAGFGVAAIFPMTFTMTSKSKKYAPGVAISLVATYATVGVLIGPPLIGYIAHLFKLQYAFVLFFIAILTIIPLSRQLFVLLDADKN